MLAFLDYPYGIIEKARTMCPGVDTTATRGLVEGNFLEDYFALIEREMVPILKQLRGRDLSFGTAQARAYGSRCFLPRSISGRRGWSIGCRPI
jgi:hypothetical protein